MILSVNVPQMVNGSDAGSLSFSLEGMSQEEVVGIYGREEMTISFEADSGSCMGSEKGYVSFFFKAQVSIQQSAYISGSFVQFERIWDKQRNIFDHAQFRFVIGFYFPSHAPFIHKQPAQSSSTSLSIQCARASFHIPSPTVTSYCYRLSPKPEPETSSERQLPRLYTLY